MISLFDYNWTQLFFGSEDFSFALEVAVRTIIMFVVIILGLRLLGKRGVKQLSVFELVVIIGLGSAAGDPMFYKEVGILFSIVVFAVIIILYEILTYILGKSKKFEQLLEGKPTLLIKNGVFMISNFKKENLGSDEFFAELRVKGVSQLGQIEIAIEETSGEISIFYFDDDHTLYGLPTLLDSLSDPIHRVSSKNYYSCTFCGYTEEKEIGSAGSCHNCGHQNWVKASNKVRIA